MVNTFQLKMETEVGTTSVTQASPESLTTKLNRLALECGFNNITRDPIHIIRRTGQQTGVDVVYNRIDEAFTLINPIAAHIVVYIGEGRNPPPVDFAGVVGIKRILMSYSAMSRIETAVDMQRAVGPLINEGVKDFIDEFGYIGSGYKITAERPGWHEDYFRELEDTAAFELRLTLIKE